jgi:hypothetical protein
MIRTLFLLTVLLTPCLVGCGEGASARPTLYPVTGTVTLNGVPVEGANVTFACEKAPRSATGVTDATGKFSLTSYDTNDGAIAGDHVVTISKVAAQAQGATISEANAKEMMAKNIGAMSSGKTSEMKPEMVLPEKYADAKTSGEKRTVSATEANDFKFDLKP